MNRTLHCAAICEVTLEVTTNSRASCRQIVYLEKFGTFIYIANHYDLHVWNGVFKQCTTPPINLASRHKRYVQHKKSSPLRAGRYTVALQQLFKLDSLLIADVRETRRFALCVSGRKRKCDSNQKERVQLADWSAIGPGTGTAPCRREVETTDSDTDFEGICRRHMRTREYSLSQGTAVA